MESAGFRDQCCSIRGGTYNLKIGGQQIHLSLEQRMVVIG
jgi:hypothetical protein